MHRITEYRSEAVMVLLLLASSLAGTLVAFTPEHSIAPIGPGDGLLLAFLALHVVWAVETGFQLLRNNPPGRDHTARAAEVFFFFGAFLFLFDYIFASNAGMDYVQRFIAGGGTIQLAPDTRTERLLVAGKFLPLVLTDLAVWGHYGIVRNPRRERNIPAVLMLLAVALSVLSFPSFVHKEGIPLLGWFSLAPLFVLLRREVEHHRAGRAIWYGLLYGVLFTLLGNYWLGTFNLISLQAVGVIFFGFYLLYMPVAVGMLVVLRAAGERTGAAVGYLRFATVLILPLTWTTFELARSSGFLGYPWLLVAHSQYQVPWMIQTARLGGVWLVSFIILLTNAFLAEGVLRRRFRWVLAAGGVVLINGLAGLLVLWSAEAEEPENTVSIALIQQNSDPRKHEYTETLDSLMGLTDESLEYNPDLVVWSETAFVPNIRRWSREDPERHSLAALVRDFYAYLDTVDTWLLTGNDDYQRNFDEDGRETGRDSYNAAVLFTPDNRRAETYHKVKLVPFTEHFPYQEELPWVYEMLMSVDIHFWTPGSEYTVFNHDRFDFATPICFEDVFPGVVRQFALKGMDVIVNISNDYWSLREQAAQQHFAGALFRTVELGRPMVRSTASGLTGHIDRQGRIVATVPQYSEEYLIARVTLPPSAAGSSRETLYYRWGDWFPRVTLVLAVLLVLVGAAGDTRGVRNRRNFKDE
jgi:apolipoprotein N-acyltransferase